jgi:hypothetical protein
MPKKQIELACPACRSNRLSFPPSDDDPVTCEDFGVAVQSLRAVKSLVSGGDGKTPAERAVSRRERHLREIEKSQAQVRQSIKETDRLVVQADKMLRRHHKECDDDVG